MSETPKVVPKLTPLEKKGSVWIRQVRGGYIVEWNINERAVCTDLFDLKQLLTELFGEKD